jgi:thiamine biosynthesis protein ThiS
MLLSLLGLVSSTCLVEVNGEVPPRNQWPQFFLKDGDRVEIFRVAAGG